MKRAILQNRIYLDSTPELVQKLLKELTYHIPNYRPDLPPKVVSTVRIINEKLVAIPSGREDLIPDNYEIINRRNEVPVEFPKFKFELRESQRKVYDAIESDAFINAWTSWGKTFTALAIAGKLSQKTLIIVHTMALRDQWVEECEKVFGFTPSLIGDGSFDTSMPITIGSVQTLVRRNKLTYQKEFGTVIVDECHHSPAKSFVTLLDKIDAKYKIGLSASNRRKDGMHVLFSDLFSKTRFTPPKENFMVPSIDRVHLPILVPDGIATWAEKMSDLCMNETYQKTVALLAATYASKGHKVLVVSSRTKLLTRCHKLTPKSVCVIGKTKDRKEQINKIKTGEAKILYGSINIFAEGISVNELSCLILATPMNNEPLLEQLIGRIIRLYPDKLDPVLVDIILKGRTMNKQAQLRKGYYMRMGYLMRDILK